MHRGKPILTRIAAKFQVTVPPEIRDIFDLREGDLFQWHFDEISGELRIIPQRAQLLSPQVRLQVERLQEARKQAIEAKQRAHEEVRESKPA